MPIDQASKLRALAPAATRKEPPADEAKLRATLEAMRQWTPDEREIFIALLLEDRLAERGEACTQIDFSRRGQRLFVIAGMGDEANALAALVGMVADAAEAQERAPAPIFPKLLRFFS